MVQVQWLGFGAQRIFIVADVHMCALAREEGEGEEGKRALSALRGMRRAPRHCRDKAQPRQAWCANLQMLQMKEPGIWL